MPPKHADHEAVTSLLTDVTDTNTLRPVAMPQVCLGFRDTEITLQERQEIPGQAQQPQGPSTESGRSSVKPNLDPPGSSPT